MFTIVRRHSNKLKVLIALALLLSLPFLGNLQHASALQPMNHTDQDMHISCASYCASMNRANPHQAVINAEEVRAPDPMPYDYQAYYSQFRYLPLPKAPKPQDIFGLASFRPPDLVTLYANFRL